MASDPETAAPGPAEADREALGLVGGVVATFGDEDEPIAVTLLTQQNSLVHLRRKIRASRAGEEEDEPGDSVVRRQGPLFEFEGVVPPPPTADGDGEATPEEGAPAPAAAATGAGRLHEHRRREEAVVEAEAPEPVGAAASVSSSEVRVRPSARVAPDRMAPKRHFPRPSATGCGWIGACVCPCVSLGRLATRIADPCYYFDGGDDLGVVPPPGKQGKKKRTKSHYCLQMDRRGWSTCCAASLWPLSTIWVARLQRRDLERIYGITEGDCRSSKCGRCCCYCLVPCCYARAIVQHESLLRRARAEGHLRYPWESSQVWSLAGSPQSQEATQVFNVVVFGPPQVGVTSFVRSMIGVGAAKEVPPPPESNRLEHPTLVTLGTRIICVPGRPHSACSFWDLPARADLTASRAVVDAADAAVCVFDPQDNDSLYEALLMYRDAFAATPPPPVKLLVGNRYSGRSAYDRCEFRDEVAGAAIEHGMHFSMTAVQVPSAKGTKRLLDFLAAELWTQRDRILLLRSEGETPRRRQHMNPRMIGSPSGSGSSSSSIKGGRPASLSSAAADDDIVTVATAADEGGFEPPGAPEPDEADPTVVTIQPGLEQEEPPRAAAALVVDPTADS